MKITEYLHKTHGDVGSGWQPLVKKLCEDIIKVSSKVEVSQVKEKFGGLRFYINSGNEKIRKLIGKAENESFKICERCGTRNGVTTEGGWLLTLCKKCRGLK